MKVLFGTGNQAKLTVMKNRLEKIDIELIGLNDLRTEGKTIPEVHENGNTPLENARLKALAYYKAFQIPDCILIMSRTRFSRVCMFVMYMGNVCQMKK